MKGDIAPQFPRSSSFHLALMTTMLFLQLAIGEQLCHNTINYRFFLVIIIELHTIIECRRILNFEIVSRNRCDGKKSCVLDGDAEKLGFVTECQEGLQYLKVLYSCELSGKLSVYNFIAKL